MHAIGHIVSLVLFLAGAWVARAELAVGGFLIILSACCEGVAGGRFTVGVLFGLVIVAVALQLGVWIVVLYVSAFAVTLFESVQMMRLYRAGDPGVFSRKHDVTVRIWRWALRTGEPAGGR